MHNSFEITCKECGARSVYNPDIDALSIRILFKSGSPNTRDRMIILCNKCGNNKEYGIYWPLDIHNA